MEIIVIVVSLILGIFLLLWIISETKSGLEDTRKRAKKSEMDIDILKGKIVELEEKIKELEGRVNADIAD